uniref:ARAD1D48906p n=1 Tax=Blastobotrys adeninivorans TaxID=409370 RepID=A0A060TE41_BLAAD
MSNLKFVIHSSFNGSEVSDESHRPKRAKHACLGCQSRKVRCSGVYPCELCQARKIECVFTPSVHKRRTTKHHITDASALPPPPAMAPTSSNTTATDSPASATSVTTPPTRTMSETQFLASRKRALESASTSAKKKPRFQVTRHPYFRWLGPTAIAPPKTGTFRLLSVNLRSKSDPHKSVVIERQPGSLEEQWSPSQDREKTLNSLGITQITEPLDLHRDDQPGADTADHGTTGDDRKREKDESEDKDEKDDEDIPLPPKESYKCFFDNMTNSLPFLSVSMFEDRLNQGLIGECLLYAMAAISERLNPSVKNNQAVDGSPTPSLAEKYADAAKRRVIPHLSTPSPEIVYALLLIAYSEFGEDRDSGLWMWSGMAIRMCYDLGLHKKDTRSEDSTEDQLGRRIFWSTVCLDRLICCGTGRMCSIPDCDLEYSCDFGSITGPDGESRTDPFPYLCRLLILMGKVSNYINSLSNKTDKMVRAGTNPSVSPSSLSPESWDMMETFSQFQHELSDFYNALPPDLLFDVQNFQQFSKIRYSQVFLLLHVWNQALVLAVHHPKIAYPQAKLDVAGLMSNPHADLTGTGSISIADMVAFADLIDANSFLANPFLSQPIYMAACASLTLWHSLPPSAPSHSMYTLQRTYSTCRQILQRMQRIWRGISWHSRTLDSLAASEPDVDLSVDANGYVVTSDLGVVRKASIDETTRRWLVDEMGDGTDDIYGLFIAGLTDPQNMDSGATGATSSGRGNGSNGSNGPNGPSSATDSTGPVNPTQPITPPERNDYKLPPRPSLTRATSAGNPGGGSQEDTFRSIVLRNMDLDEYLRPGMF